MWTCCVLCAHPSGDRCSLAFDPASLGVAHLAVTWRAACSPLEAGSPGLCLRGHCLRGQELQPTGLLMSSALEPLLLSPSQRSLFSAGGGTSLDLGVPGGKERRECRGSIPASVGTAPAVAQAEGLEIPRCLWFPLL